MEEEITYANNYADWIMWVSDVEKGKQANLWIYKLCKNACTITSPSNKQWWCSQQLQRTVGVASQPWNEHKMGKDLPKDLSWSQPRWGKKATTLESLRVLPRCVCLEQKGTRLLYHWKTFPKHIRVSTLQGISWWIILLGRGRGEKTDRCSSGSRQNET
jgi:hypothetical protein